MNKIHSLSLLFLAALSLSGCSNEEADLFDASAAERLNQAQTKYSSFLTSSRGGWAMEYYATNDSVGNSESDFKSVGYLLTARFDTDGSVTMGMNNAFSFNRYLSDKSLWDIITDEGPVLSFSTYNDCIHSFSNPDDLPSSIRGGGSSVQGLGAEGDYEFVITDLQKDAEIAFIKGKKRGTYVRMTRIPEGTDFQKYIADCDSFRNMVFGASRTSEPIMTVGSQTYCIQAASKAETPKIYPYHGDSILTMLRRPFLITHRDGSYYLRFKNAFTLSGDSVVQEFVYNEANHTFTGVGDGNERYTIQGQQPLTFFNDKLTSGRTWRFLGSEQNAETFNSTWSALTTALRKIKYSLNGNYFNLNMVDGTARLYLTVRTTKGGIVPLYYNFDVDASNGNLKLTYSSPADKASTTLLNAVPAIKSLLDAVSDSYAVSSVVSPFDLGTLRLTSASSSDKWMNLHLIN